MKVSEQTSRLGLEEHGQVTCENPGLRDTLGPFDQGWDFSPHQTIELGTGVTVGDIDGDGWLDILKSEFEGSKILYRARCGDAAWIQVDLDGPPGNPHGLGAQFIVEVDDTTQSRWISDMAPGYMSRQPARVHFGLSTAAAVGRLVVRWLTGQQTEFTQVPTRQRVTVQWIATSAP